MSRTLSPGGLIDQRNYLFEGAGLSKDDLFGAFAEACRKNNMPVKLTEEKYNTSLFGKGGDTLLTIDGGFKPFAVLGAINYGNFLSVSVYFLVEESFTNLIKSTVSRIDVTSLAYISKDMVTVRNQNAFWQTVVATLEEAFHSLDYKEFQGGFLGVK